MDRRLVVSPQSDLDVQAASVWHEEQRSGLGLQFLHQLDLVFQRIRDNPRQFPCLEAEVRRALLRHFPYGVYFIGEPETIAVLAVLHLHREPDMWKERS